MKDCVTEHMDNSYCTAWLNLQKCVCVCLENKSSASAQLTLTLGLSSLFCFT